MRAPAAMLLIESSQQDSTVIGEWGGGVAPGHPSPHSFLSEAPTRQPGLFFVPIGFPSASPCAAFRGRLASLSHKSGIAVPGTELVRNERTNWTAVALIL
jgi:hypothetical protein